MAILNSSGQEVVSYTYDEEGKLTAVNDGISGKTTTYYYDALDRLTLKEIRASGVLSLAVRYQYNEEDQLIGKTVFSDGQTPVHTAYAYDHLHNLSQITGEDVFQRISYSSHGLLEQTTTGYTSGGADHTVKQETYVYGTADTSLHQHTVTYGGKTNTATYTYDGRGNITQITRKVDSTEYIIKYTYDAANQLVREYNQLAGYCWAMTYDDAGNMLTRKKYNYANVNLATLTPIDVQTFTYEDSAWGDRLATYNGFTIASDDIGNITRNRAVTYTWKNGRQLASYSKGSTWTYEYDAGGMRTKRTDGSTTYTYTYDGSTLTRMTVGSNTLVFTYGANGQPMTVKYKGINYYYVTNALGDVIAIVNSSGTEVVTYVYDAWGNNISTAGTMASTLGKENPLRYRGYVYDEGLGLYYLQSRYYNPQFCRFLSADTFVSTGQGILGYNMFAYCGNNPVNRIDPDGYFWQDVWSAIVDAAYWLYYNATKWHFEDREQLNGDHPTFEDVTKLDSGWRKLKPEESIYHDNHDEFPEYKFITDDGREAVFDGKTYEPMTDPMYIATYNYCPLYEMPDNPNLFDYGKLAVTGVGHFLVDMLPYYLTGFSNTRKQLEAKIIMLFN